MTSTTLDAMHRTALKPRGLGFALAGMIVGLLYGAVSVYWGLGGTALLATVGGSLEQGGRAGDLGVLLVLWAAVVLKLTAAVLPLVAIYRLGGVTWQRLVRVLAWIEAGMLVVYGLVLTIVGLTVQLGVIAASASADHRAIAWHAYLWDPWFLTWGLLVAATLLRARHRNRETELAAHHGGPVSVVALSGWRRGPRARRRPRDWRNGPARRAGPTGG